MAYTIIIPIHDEVQSIPILLEGLKSYAVNHEILIIDDGSTDGSSELLENCSFIHLVSLSKNSGKGTAIRAGLDRSGNDKVIITDGDLELDPAELEKFMILDSDSKIDCVLGTRYAEKIPFGSLLNFGNFFLTGFFNIIHNRSVSDALCCNKSFFKSSIDQESLKSTGFDVDVELLSKLVSENHTIKEIPIKYTRRSPDQGKKLRLVDGWIILKRIWGQ